MRSKKISSIKKLVILIAILALSFLALINFKSLKPEPIPTPLPQPSTAPKNLTGMYKGQLPCADCPGIEETLVLAGTKFDSGTYILEDVYLEKSTTPFRTQGTWVIYNGLIKLIPSDNSQFSYFQILDNGNLQMLDPNQQKIDSPFNQILTRQN